MGSPTIFNGAFVKFLKNAMRFGALDADPANPAIGDAFVPGASHPNKTAGYLHVYDGTNWIDHGPAAESQGVGGGSVFGILMSGFIGGAASTASAKFTFSTETDAAATASTISNRYTGSFHSADKGYQVGGQVGATRSDDCVSYNLSTEATTSLLAILAVTISNLDDGGTDGLTGSIFGGEVTVTGTVNTIYIMTYSTETFATSSSTVPVAQMWSAVVSGPTEQYIAGGSTTTASTSSTTNLYKMVDATETVTTLTSIGTAVSIAQGASSETEGWVICGRNSGTNHGTDLQKITFATDTPSAGTDMTLSKGQAMATYTALEAYNHGGFDGAQSATSEKLTFSTGANSSVTDTLNATHADGASFQV